MSPSPRELHDRLVRCATHAQAVDVRPFELRPASEVVVGLVPPVVEVLSDAIDVCRGVVAAYDPVESAASPESALEDVLGDDGESEGRSSSVFHVDLDALVGGTGERRAVADVAFLGVTELRPKLARVERLGRGADPWEVVAECGSGLRRVGKSLTAIEVVLCRVEGLDARLSFSTQLARSLEVRAQYARLRRTIVRTEPGPASLQRCLRRVGTAIAMLIGKDVYPELRIHDRRQLRELQARILDWLRREPGRGTGGGETAEHTREGMRLWQDLVGFAGLLAQVSRRQELIEHDAAQLDRVHGALRAARGERVGEDAIATLCSLRGLDDEVDELLEEQVVSLAAWAPVVRRLHRAISEPTTGVHATSGGGAW
jgi:hypothetical protein